MREFIHLAKPENGAYSPTIEDLKRRSKHLGGITDFASRAESETSMLSTQHTRLLYLRSCMGITATTLAIRSVLQISENRYSKSPDQIHIEDMDLICSVIAFQFILKRSSLLIDHGMVNSVNQPVRLSASGERS